MIEDIFQQDRRNILLSAFRVYAGDVTELRPNTLEKYNKQGDMWRIEVHQENMPALLGYLVRIELQHEAEGESDRIIRIHGDIPVKVDSVLIGKYKSYVQGTKMLRKHTGQEKAVA